MHSFTQISIEACENRWCWRLVCTTCGAMQLRSKIAEIAGLTQNEQKHLPHLISQSQYLGEKLIEAFKDISVFELHDHSCFPDRLGHIGILLAMTRAAEEKSLTLTNLLIPQFTELLGHTVFADNIKNNKPLEPRDLELIEKELERKEKKWNR